MVSDEVPLARFTGGTFPPLCSRTGTPTTDRARLVADRRPVWLAVAMPVLLGTVWLSETCEEALLGVLLLLVGTTMPLVLDRVTVRGRLSKDGARVLLVHVHPAFADAVSASARTDGG